MKEGVCRFCSLKKPLIKAHIIPEKFYLLAVENEKDRLIIIDKRKPYTPACPIGIYDENILCKGCDNHLGIYDEAIQKLLLSDLTKYKHADKDLYEVPATEFDYSKIKLFFVAMIWRAAISSMDPFRNVALGAKYERLALDILKNPLLDKEDFFRVIIFKFKSIPEFRIEGFFEQPTRVRLENGTNSYRFVFGGYVVYIKVDNRPYTYPYYPICFKPNENLFMVDADPKQEKVTLERMEHIWRERKKFDATKG